MYDSRAMVLDWKYGKTNIKPKQLKKSRCVLIHPFSICPRYKREPNFKLVTSTHLLNHKISTLSDKKGTKAVTRVVPFQKLLIFTLFIS